MAVTSTLIPGRSAAQVITKDFTNVPALTSADWSIQNLSNPLGSTGWTQGNILNFTAQNGAASSYAGVGVSATSASFPTTGTISSWLITPNRTFRNGDVISFTPAQQRSVLQRTAYRCA